MKNISLKNRMLMIIGLISVICKTSVGQNTSYDQDNIPIVGGGGNNVGIGWQVFNSLVPATVADFNTGLGYQTLWSVSSASFNTAVGYKALFNTNGAANTAVGAHALFNNNTGMFNSAFGRGALFANTSGVYNTATGYNSLQQNNGNSNTANGFYCLTNNTTGDANTAIGVESLFINTTGQYNTACGVGALAVSNGNDNSAFGGGALVSNTTGYENTAVGRIALNVTNSGFENTGIGSSALAFNQIGNDNTGIGAYCDVTGIGFVESAAIGAYAISNASNRIWLGSPAVIDIWGMTATFIASDGRFKTDISDKDMKGLEFIKLLRPVTYNLDTRKFTEHITQNFADSIKRKHLSRDFGPSSKIRYNGFIAQEVEEAARKSGFYFSGVHTPKDKTDTYGISYETFVVPLVKGMQEQQEQIENLKNQIEILTAELEKLNSSNKYKESQNSKIGNLSQNEPNPFNSATKIKYTLPGGTKNADLLLYDFGGKLLTSIKLNLEENSIVISGNEMTPGIYFYTIVADGEMIDFKRMVVNQKE